MLKRFSILLLLLLPVLCNTVAGEAYYVVTANTLNVRSDDSMYGVVKYQLHKGDTIMVISNQGQWAMIGDDGNIYYVNSKYIRYVGQVPQKLDPAVKSNVSKWDKWYDITRVILWILAAIVVLGYFVSETVAGYALWMQIICGIGALIGWLFFNNGAAGAVIAMGAEVSVFAIGVIIVIVSATDIEWPHVAGLAHFVWAVVSLPFYMLNLLQFWLAKPWRPLLKRNIFPDKSKPGMRVFLRILQVPFYIVVTPLRLANAIYYNMLIYNLYAWSNYIVEVLVPSDYSEGAHNIIDWLAYLPKRIGKYLLWHGVLTSIESVVWTVIDTFVPAITLYHGTAVEYADNMLCDPRRNQQRERTKGWLTGIWNVGGGNYAGDGIYFGIFRKTLRNYEQGSAIATRVTMGKTIDTVLMPDYVYNQAGHPDAKAVSNWGLNNGYVCGEWWRSDRGTNWWEICMYDRQNRYNESWRIRPIYAIHAHSGIMQRIPGGAAHWLFRKQVINDLWDTLTNK